MKVDSSNNLTTPTYSPLSPNYQSLEYNSLSSLTPSYSENYIMPLKDVNICIEQEEKREHYFYVQKTTQRETLKNFHLT